MIFLWLKSIHQTPFGALVLSICYQETINGDDNRFGAGRCLSDFKIHRHKFI
jgi:hypothetical protein